MTTWAQGERETLDVRERQHPKAEAPMTGKIPLGPRTQNNKW